MGEDSLGWLLLSIESELAAEVDYNKVIDYFARIKPERKDCCSSFIHVSHCFIVSILRLELK